MKKILFSFIAAAMSINSFAEGNKTITWPDGTSHEVKPIVTMKVAVDGETERLFNFGSYKEENFYAVDFGDGELVVTDIIGLNNSNVTNESIKGIAKGDGNITVYAEDGSDVWYFGTSVGTSTTSSILSIDLSSLKKVQQMSISGAAVSTIDVSACDSLKVFTAAKGALKTMDFSKNLKITSINLTDNELESLNIKNNIMLDQLTVYNNKLTSLDLTPNAAMTGLYANNNKIASVKFAPGAVYKVVNLSDNELTEIDVPEITGSTSMLMLSRNKLETIAFTSTIGNVELANNKLKSVSIGNANKSCLLANNCLTIATLPKKPAGLNSASKIKKFTYGSQEPMEVACVGNVLDLSAQLTAEGELEEGTATTNYVFVDSENNKLVEGTDYTIKDGVATFLKSFTRIHAEMTNDAFPKVTAEDPFKTVEFDVTVDPTAINSVSSDSKNGTIYNINGVKVASPTKGVNILNGKKFFQN